VLGGSQAYLSIHWPGHSHSISHWST